MSHQLASAPIAHAHPSRWPAAHAAAAVPALPPAVTTAAGAARWIPAFVIDRDDAGLRAGIDALHAFARRSNAEEARSLRLELDRMVDSPWFLAVAASCERRAELCADVRRLRDRLSADANDARTQVRPVSRREREVLDLISQGLTNKQAAARLGLSPQTIKRHLARIAQRLGLHTRTSLAMWYARGGTGSTGG